MKSLFLAVFLAATPVALAQDAGTPDAGAAVVAVVGTAVTAPAADHTASPAATAAAAAAAQPPDIAADPASFAGQVWNAFELKDWGKLLFFGITILVFVLRKYLGPKFPVLLTAPGSVAMNFALAFGGMLATSWPAGTKVTPHAVMTALYGGFIAAGGWTIAKNLWEHFVEKGANPAAPAAAPPAATPKA